MRIEQASLLGSAFIGVYAATNEEYTFLPHNADESFAGLVEDVLKTEVVRASVAGSTLLGIMTAMNSRCIALPKTAYSDEIEMFRSYLDVVVVEGFTAVGNTMTANDKGMAVSPLLRASEIKGVSEAFGVEAVPLALGGLDITGSSTYATNQGFLANPNISKEEFRRLKSIFGTGGAIGSLNYGNPFVKGSILANSNGAIVGSQSTPFELGRVDDALFPNKEVVKNGKGV